LPLLSTSPSFHLQTPLPSPCPTPITLNLQSLCLSTSVKHPQKPEFCSHATLMGKQLRVLIIPCSFIYLFVVELLTLLF
jgi:hypothetical protein